MDGQVFLDEDEDVYCVWRGEFDENTNICSYGMDLFQRHGDQEKVIAYASRTLSDTERKFSATEQECLAVIWGIRKMRPYLEGYHFIVITDHQSLKWLHTIQNPSGRLARWALEMQQYNFIIEYRKEH